VKLELAPFNVFKTILGCQGVNGPFPLPFLISESQRTGAKLSAGF